MMTQTTQDANIQPNLWSSEAAEAARLEGMDIAAANKASLLEHARKVAEAIGRRKAAVSADDVAEALECEGISIFALGNAMGSCFRGGKWQWTGRFVKSRRTHAKGNLLRVWTLK